MHGAREQDAPFFNPRTIATPRKTYERHEVYAALKKRKNGEPIFVYLCTFDDILGAYEKRSELRKQGIPAEIRYKKHGKTV